MFKKSTSGDAGHLPRGPLFLAGLLAAAVLAGLVLGVGVALITGVGGKDDTVANGGVPYTTTREAFSEFEPPRKSGQAASPPPRSARLTQEKAASPPPRSARLTQEKAATPPPRNGARAPLPRLAVKPGTVIQQPGLPVEGAVPPGVTKPAIIPPPEDPAATKAPASAPTSGPTSGQVAALPGQLPAWKRNAVPVALAPNLPVIGVVIDDLGLDLKRTERAMTLPAPVTLAFLPYGRHLPDETARAHARGHELLVHVAMEPEGSADPGPNPLLTALLAAENRARLDWALTRFQGYVGINNHMGSKFTSDAAAMDVVAAELKARGLLFLDSRTAATAVGYARAKAAEVPAATRQVFLDRDPARAAIDNELKRLEAQARKYGKAIAIGHPHDATLDALDAWLPTLKAKGLQLAPVSALVEEGAGASAVARPAP